MDTDSALRLLGKYSKWQLQKYLFFSLAFGIVFAWVYMPIVFVSDTPEHRCFVPSIDDNDLNNSSGQLNQSVPFEERDGELLASRCEQFVNFTYLSNKTERCTHGYWYDPASGYESTIVTDFNLVCGKSFLVEITMTVYAVGSVFGNIVYPVVSDRFGRRPVFLVCVCGVALMNTLKAFSPNYYVYTGLMFLAGMQEQGMMSVSIIMVMELFPTESRTFAGILIEFAWVTGVVTLAPIAYLVRNWRHLVLLTSGPCCLTFLYYWVIPESIPWLVANNREQEAERILRSAAKFNNITLPQNIFIDNTSQKNNNYVTDKSENKIMTEKSCSTYRLKSVNDENNSADHQSTSPVTLIPPASGALTGSMTSLEFRQRKKRENSFKKTFSSFKLKNKNKVKAAKDVLPLSSVTSMESVKYEASPKDLIKSPTLRKYVISLAFIWFANNFVYISLTLTLTSLAGDRYLNFFLYGLVELPAYGVCWIAMEKLGRRGPLIAFHFLCGASLILTVLQVTDFASSITALIITLNMIGKFAISASWATMYVLSPEVFPTNIRTIGTGICQFAARVAIFIGPYTRVLDRHVAWMPQVILGTVSIIGGLCALVLPETRWRPLPETVEQVELWDGKKENTETEENS